MQPENSCDAGLAPALLDQWEEDAARIVRDLMPRKDEEDSPTVCIAHGRFIPCRKDGEHRYTSNPYWVKSVRDYQGSPIEDLTWEPAWEAKSDD